MSLDRENYGMSLAGVYLFIALLLLFLTAIGVGTLWVQMRGDTEIGIYSPMSPDDVRIITD